MSQIKIDGQSFELGQHGMVKIDIADLPSGTIIHLPIHVFRSSKPGPTILISAGLHGDEVNGVEIVRRTLVENLYDQMLVGSAIVIPIINIYGFINFSREVPDGKDVNRSFPGSAKGSLASQVANVLSKEIIPQIDFGIDFHTGGGTRYNYPQIRYTAGNEKSKEIANAFAAPVTISNNVIPKSFREEVIKQGKSNIVFEGAEASRYDEFSVLEALKGIKRVMVYYDMLPTAFNSKANEQHHFTKMHWQRAEKSGLFIWEISSGKFVQKGDLLASIHDPHNTYQIPVLADQDGFIIGHNNSPIVNAGDAIFHYGYN